MKVTVKQKGRRIEVNSQALKNNPRLNKPIEESFSETIQNNIVELVDNSTLAKIVSIGSIVVLGIMVLIKTFRDGSNL